MTDQGPHWPRAAIFDCDGLLIDSRHCWERAYADIAQSNSGHRQQLDMPGLNGASVPEAAQRLAAELRISVSPAALLTSLDHAFVNHPPQPLRGARPLMARLAPRMPLAVASNAPRQLVEQALHNAGLLSFFQTIVSAEETPAFKPEPHVYLEACSRLAVDPSDAIAFEDSRRGATAARRAGLTVVGVPSISGIRLHADLLVSGLDDPRLTSYLNLD